MSENKLILVVDDDLVFRQNVVNLLRKANYRVLVARDAFDALGILERELPDLIISDIIMPGMDGHEFCKKVRDNPRTQGIAFLMLTVRDRPEDVVEGLEVFGADEYVTKPIRWGDLKSTIDYLLKYVSGRGNYKAITLPEKVAKPGPVGAAGTGDVAAKDARRLFEEGLQLIRNQDYRGAIDRLEKAAEQDPNELKYQEFLKKTREKRVELLFRRPGMSHLVPKRLVDDPGKIIDMALDSEQTYVYSIINGTDSIRTLVAGSGIDHRKTLTIIGQLMIRGALDLCDEKGNPQ